MERCCLARSEHFPEHDEKTLQATSLRQHFGVAIQLRSDQTAELAVSTWSFLSLLDGDELVRVIRAEVIGARADQAVVIELLDDVSRPAAHP